MDLTSFLGLIIGFASIITGQFLEGGNLMQLTQITAAFIVFGGTFGAVILSYPAKDILNSIYILKDVFFTKKTDYEEIISEIVKFSHKARKEGVIVLEREARKTSDPLLALGLEAVSDGAEPAFVKNIMEIHLMQLETKIYNCAKVWESAGGYAPTFGIVGAVMGLIQVMYHLSDPIKLGVGIAVAFVATLYGLIAANLVFLPIGTKIRTKFRKLIISKELIIEGVLSIQSGESPVLIERKLQAFILGKRK